jgi:alkaline phosphatase
VLGAFAADDTFNDEPEEALIRLGLVDDRRARDDRRGRLLIWGSPAGTLGADPPTAAEMADLALVLLTRHSRRAGKPFLLVVEIESTDNLANANNAVGALRALHRADDVIDRARAFLATAPDTLVLVAADSDAGGLQAYSAVKDDMDARTTAVDGNPTGRPKQAVEFPMDGVEGRGSPPFHTLPDARGRSHPFAVLWTGVHDVAGGILVRADGLNANDLSGRFAGTIDNTDIYRLIYLTLFGSMPDDS